MSPGLVIALLGLAFVSAHVLLSHPPVRAWLVGVFGEWPFRGLYSVVALGIFVPWVLTWWRHRHTTGRLWELYGPLEVFAVGVGIIGFSLIAAGLVTPTPSFLAPQPNGGRLPLTAISHITRHPVNVGIGHWAAAHLVVTPTLIDFGFYGPMLLMSVVGILHQDWRMKQASEAYREFAAATTILPDPRGLATLDTRSWTAIGVGTFAAVILYSLHPYLFMPG